MGLVRLFSFVLHPPLIGVELWKGLRVLEPILHIDANGSRRLYNLRGVIYFSCDHFTARVVNCNGMVWFHDGLFTGKRLVYESSNMSSIPTGDSILVIYIRDDSHVT
ncbi:hypothetical protein BGW80DRAFT_1182264 [Lactifluus volemus]|nr:hypothetical protein BGW80DRAFT_1182264 [Lactifluus volemus]